MKKIIILLLLLLLICSLPAQDKKLLPVEIKGEDYLHTYTYDDLNRFTSIKRISDNEVTKHDTIIYLPEGKGLKRYSIIKSTSEPVNDNDIYYVRYEKKGDTILVDDGLGIITVSLSPSGLVRSMKIEYSAASFTINYIYDKNDNLLNMSLSGNSLPMPINKFDNKNGIFKYVNRRECFLILYDDGDEFPYKGYLENNFVSTESEDNPVQVKYEYNEYGYPIMKDGVSIKYIEAH